MRGCAREVCECVRWCECKSGGRHGGAACEGWGTAHGGLHVWDYTVRACASESES